PPAEVAACVEWQGPHLQPPSSVVPCQDREERRMDGISSRLRGVRIGASLPVLALFTAACGGNLVGGAGGTGGATSSSSSSSGTGGSGSTSSSTSGTGGSGSTSSSASTSTTSSSTSSSSST